MARLVEPDGTRRFAFGALVNDNVGERQRGLVVGVRLHPNGSRSGALAQQNQRGDRTLVRDRPAIYGEGAFFIVARGPVPRNVCVAMNVREGQALALR